MLKFTGTLSRLAFCAFALSLSGCVPTASPPFKAKDWVYSALVPTEPEINRACDLGYQAGLNRSEKSVLGTVLRKLNNSNLVFRSVVGNTFIDCWLSGIAINPSKPRETPKRPASVWIRNSTTDVKNTRVSLEFKDLEGNIINTISASNGEVAKGDASFQIFLLPEWSNLQIIQMKQSSSFTVLIVQSQTEQRYEFKREDFDGLL
jgi:hypothetical protein